LLEGHAVTEKFQPWDEAWRGALRQDFAALERIMAEECIRVRSERVTSRST
jgi:hypothetical protein